MHWQTSRFRQEKILSSKKRKSRRRAGAARPTRRQQAQRQWRNLRQAALALVLTMSVVGVGLAAFKHNYDISHDLSVIGKGVPTVVQIHDPGCRLCNQLRTNTSDAVDRLDDRILYRIADITTPDGKRLQRKHRVQHVTLLLFDGDGELRRVLEGVRDEDEVHGSLLRHLERWGSNPVPAT